MRTCRSAFSKKKVMIVTSMHILLICCVSILISGENKTIKSNTGNQQTEILKLSYIEGSVVDTNRNPVPQAIITLRWEHTVQIEGTRKNVKYNTDERYKTDSNGYFKIENIITEKGNLLFDVEAAGFASIEGIYVRRLKNGRMQSEQREFRDNIIELQKPGIISGRVSDVNNAPLKDSRLRYISLGYSPYNAERKILTDSNGLFTIHNVRPGSCLLYCYKIRTFFMNSTVIQGQATVIGTQYEGPISLALCQITEGQDINDVVLDLSKSTASVELEITDQKGKAVTSARIYVSHRIPYENGNVSYEFLWFDASNEDGIYHIPNLPAGPFELQTAGRNHRSDVANVELKVNSTAKCKIVLDDEVINR